MGEKFRWMVLFFNGDKLAVECLDDKRQLPRVGETIIYKNKRYTVMEVTHDYDNCEYQIDLLI